MKLTETQGFNINVSQEYFAEGPNRKYVLTASSPDGRSIKKTRTTYAWTNIEIAEVVTQLTLRVIDGMTADHYVSSSSTDFSNDWNASKSSWNY